MKRVFKAANGAKFTRDQGFTLIRDHAGIVAAVDSRDLEEYAAELTDARAKDETIKALQQQLASIDSILARRQALDDCATREEKILKAIRTASRVPLLEALCRDVQRALAELSTKPFPFAIEARLRQVDTIVGEASVRR